MSDEQPDYRLDEFHEDLITGHPFEPAAFRDAWPGICGHVVDGWPCGYSREEHEDKGGDAIEVP